MEELRGKKLLFLGGIGRLCEAVEIAKEMGIYTIVTDYLENSPAKKIADKSYMISTTDVDAVVKLCEDEHVDGVFTAFIDSMLPYARRICDRLGLPFYASEDQIRMSLDKKYFKRKCTEYGVPVAQDYSERIQSQGLDDCAIRFPVVVKPVDSSGGRGVTVCYDLQKLQSAYEYAMSISPGKNVLVEEYLVGNEVTATYTMKNGEISLSGFKDKLLSTDHEDITALTDILIFPSVYLERYVKTVNEKVIHMLKQMGAVDGTVFLQGIASEDDIRFFELGYRPNGACDYRIFERANGINFLKMMIAHALTGEMKGYDLSLDNPYFSKFYLNYNMFSHEGVIGSISGLEEVLAIDNVEMAEYMRNVGDRVLDNNTLAQRVFRTVICDSDINRIKETILKIQKIVTVLDENGENLLYTPFDVERLKVYGGNE